jgi:hypothetical protein
MLITNVTLNKVSLTGSKTFGIYDAWNVKLVDSQITTPATVTNVSFYNTHITFTNSRPVAFTVTLDGCSTNGIGSTLLFYNSRAALQDTNAIAGSPGLTLGGSTLAISNNLNLDLPSVVNFVLGTNATTITVASNLVLGGTVNISAGSGFAGGSYTLFTYGRKLTWGPPTLGSRPAGYTCAFDTNTAGQVNLAVTPVPSLAPITLGWQATSNQLVLSWPLDHIGWRLQIQTNTRPPGLGTNWIAVPNAQQTNLIRLPLDPANGSVFLRLAYP